MNDMPPEVRAAREALANGLRFGDRAAIEARSVLSRWEQVNCYYCDGVGRVKAEPRRLCEPCGGRGSVWRRKG